MFDTLDLNRSFWLNNMIPMSDYTDMNNKAKKKKSSSDWLIATDGRAEEDSISVNVIFEEEY